MTEWTPKAQERFFSALYEEVADDDDQPEDVAQKVASAVGGVTRREVLAGAGILGGGALLGGGGTAALTGDAQAAASTVDGDGDIGTPANPEDVYADALAVFDGANNQIGSFDETGIQTPSVDTDSATINGEGSVLAVDEGTVQNPGFGSWFTPSAEHATIVVLEASAETDGSSDARIAIQVDYSGGTSPDSTWDAMTAPSGLGSGGEVPDTVTFPLPPGGSFNIVNVSDPNNNNSIAEVRVF